MVLRAGGPVDADLLFCADALSSVVLDDLLLRCSRCPFAAAADAVFSSSLFAPRCCCCDELFAPYQLAMNWKKFFDSPFLLGASFSRTFNPFWRSFLRPVVRSKSLRVKLKPSCFQYCCRIAIESRRSCGGTPPVGVAGPN